MSDDHAEDGRDHHPVKNPSLDAFHKEHQSDDKAKDSEQCSRRPEVSYRHNGICIRLDQPGIFKTDEGNEESDTPGNSEFQIGWDDVDDFFAYFHQAQDHEDDAGNEDTGQCCFPRDTHSDTDRKREEGVEPHTWCNPNREVSQQSDQERTHDGRERSSGEKGTFVHACLA